MRTLLRLTLGLGGHLAFLLLPRLLLRRVIAFLRARLLLDPGQTLVRTLLALLLSVGGRTALLPLLLLPSLLLGRVVALPAPDSCLIQVRRCVRALLRLLLGLGGRLRSCRSMTLASLFSAASSRFSARTPA